MYLFIICILGLYLLSYFSEKKGADRFGKEKTVPLKGVLAILIVLHHLSYDVPLLSAFHSWGAPVVSIFFFISGYGLMKSYQSKGKKYLDGFIRHRIAKVLLLPFILAWLFYRIINYDFIPSVPDSFLNLLTDGETSLPYSWFVFSILAFYLFFYAVCKLTDKFSVLFLFYLVLGYTALIWYSGYERCWYISAFAFPFGIAYGKHEPAFHRFWNIPIRYYLTVPLCLLLAATCVFLKNEAAYLFAYILFPLIFVCLCAKVKVEKLNTFGPMRWISGISYEIYLFQGISMSLLRGHYLFMDSDILYILSTLLLTIVLASGIKMLKRLPAFSII